MLAKIVNPSPFFIDVVSLGDLGKYFFVASTHLGAAVAMVSGTVAQGVIRMVQISNNNCVFEGTIDGLTPGQHAIAIHEAGDLSSGCDRLVLLLCYYSQYTGLLQTKIIDSTNPQKFLLMVHCLQCLLAPEPHLFPLAEV